MILVLDRSMNLLAMVASLWMAFYIVARGSTNRLTFRVFVLLTAVSFYYANVYLDTYAQIPLRGPYRSAAIMLGLAAAHNLRVAAGDYAIEDSHLADAIVELTRRKAPTLKTG